jgi:hypothetical protein
VVIDGGKEMKRKLKLSIALALSIVSILLMSSDSSVEAQNQLRYSARTGFITPSENQNAGIVIMGNSGNDAIAFRFRRTVYVKTNCANGVCRYVTESQTTSPQMLSAPNQSSKLDVMGNQIGMDRAVSVEVLSSSPNAVVTMQLTDAVTGQVDSVLIALLLP